MKKLILLAAALPALAMADPVCDEMSSFAEVVMQAHQSSVPMKDVLKIVEGESTISKINKSIVIDAYSQPRYHTTAVKEQAVADFRDAVHLFCLKTLKGK